MAELRVGTLGTPRMLRSSVDQRRALVARAADVGLDHLFLADHVSFFDGRGMDGLVNAATLLASHPTLHLYVGVYLLALRHPLPVARQIASLCESAPGRLSLGVGVGGEDRHEIEICGVDPATRGRRTDESLAVLRPLLAGERVTHRGEFFSFDDALIRPAPKPAVRIAIGGRSSAAVRRAGRFGDGWLGVWCSAKRFGEVVHETAAIAADAGRTQIDWRHGLQVWTACDPDRGIARARLAAAMEDMYRTPFARFERYSPAGSAAEIADFLAPYVEAGCREFNVMCIAESDEASIDAVAEVKRRLVGSVRA
jgi:alkanesulfonate monooxygenase SsuD/methylene tetrahydromethanopterin reductase-like flavin-dependent oxidoreductase (luciferase family)